MALKPLVVGVADHGGWAVLVSVAAAEGAPAVVDRRRVSLIDEGVPSQPYHHDTLALPDDKSERLLRTVRRSIAACTTQAFQNLAGDLEPPYRVRGVTIRQPPLDRLPSTVKEAHASYHVQCRADGMLYHDAICAAARQRGWAVSMHPRGEEVARAAEALQVRTAALERFVTDLRTALGPPWSAEHRAACAAAIAALTGHTRLRLP